MLRLPVAAVLAVHGLIHFMGLFACWQLATFEQLPYSTTILGGSVDVGEAGIRLVGAGWGVAGALVLAGAWLIVRRDHRALAVVAAATAVSTLMCTLGLPDAVLGLVVDLALFAVLVLRVGLEPRPLQAVRR
ncbi:MAG TPA: ABC transporter permease [Clostridia bacterium]|nr:ABC transporter permease [Clostridia bacterium]